MPRMALTDDIEWRTDNPDSFDRELPHRLVSVVMDGAEAHLPLSTSSPRLKQDAQMHLETMKLQYRARMRQLEEEVCILRKENDYLFMALMSVRQIAKADRLKEERRKKLQKAKTQVIIGEMKKQISKRTALSNDLRAKRAPVQLLWLLEAEAARNEELQATPETPQPSGKSRVIAASDELHVVQHERGSLADSGRKSSRPESNQEHSYHSTVGHTTHGKGGEKSASASWDHHYPVSLPHNSENTSSAAGRPYGNQTENASSAIEKSKNDVRRSWKMEMRPYSCKTCGKKYMKKRHLRDHVMQHSNHRPHVCSWCGKGFLRKSTLNRHQFAHTGERPYLCDFCGKGFPRKSSLMEHMYVHTGHKPFICKSCGKGFTQRATLTRHVLLHTDERPHVCETCGKGFVYKTSFNNHLLTHKDDCPHKCETCGQRFKFKCSLTNHKLMHTGEKPFVCQTCGREFGLKTNLTRHQLSHTGMRPHECQVCGKKFVLRNHLKRHMASQHSDNMPHTCDLCGEGFPSRNRLSQHMVSHLGDKPHICKTCGKAFARKTGLTRHMLMHDGTRAHECDICGKDFLLKSHLIRHRLIHMRKHKKVVASKPPKAEESCDISCRVCKNVFATTSALESHHCLAKPHVCETCGKVFTRKVQLEKHLLLHTQKAKTLLPSNSTDPAVPRTIRRLSRDTERDSRFTQVLQKTSDQTEATR